MGGSVSVKETSFPCDVSDLCGSRGSGSEVMPTPIHFHSDFCLQLCSYHSGFIVLFPRDLSCKHKTYTYSAP